MRTELFSCPAPPNPDYALFEAIHDENEPLLRAALAAGANVNKIAGPAEQSVITNNGIAYSMPGPDPDVNLTALQYAIERRYTAGVELLINHAGTDVNFAGKSAPPLSMACIYHPEAVRLLLLHPGINIHQADNSAHNPYASQRGDNIVHYAASDSLYLLKAVRLMGADFSARDNHGRTALHYAIGNPEGIEWLLKQTEIKIDDRDNFGCTALHRAAENENCIDAIKALLKHGANINALDNDDKTPLHHALTYKRKDPVLQQKVIQTLLDNGAQINWFNKEHSSSLRTALDMRTKLFSKDWEKDEQGIADLLIAKGAKHYQDLGWMAKRRIAQEMAQERSKHPSPPPHR